VTTTNDIAGQRVVRYLGLVRGITVRSRSVLGNIGAGFQSLFGGNITIFTELAEKAREEAYELMVQHATTMGANAVIGMRCTTRTRSPTGSLKCWPTAPPWWSSRPDPAGPGAKCPPATLASAASFMHDRRAGGRLAAAPASGGV